MLKFFNIDYIQYVFTSAGIIITLLIFVGRVYIVILVGVILFRIFSLSSLLLKKLKKRNKA